MRSTGTPGQRVVAAEVLLDQLAREPVDAGRHRRVRGEDASPARTASSASSNVEPVLLGELADALEAEEAGVALVGVEDLGRRARR